MRKCLVASLLVSLFVFFAGTSIVRGENKPLAENAEVAAAIAVFDAWAQQAVTDREQPGVSIGLVYDQNLVWAKGYGYADLTQKIPATPSTAYRIASLTKLFTATAILELRDAGKLQLDDPVVKYVPWFQLKDTCANSPVITIRHLLTHTSGIPRELNGLYWDDMKFPEQKEFVSLLQQSSTILPREKEFKYSNVAYSVLGYVIANVSGESYPDYIKAHVLAPLGMTGTEVLPHKDMPTLATGYKFRKPGQPREVEPFLDIKALVSAGNIASTVEDLAKFISLQFRDGPAGGAQILKGSTLREMQRVQWLNPDWKSGWGLGWGLTRVDEQARIGHSGSVPGYMTIISANPAEKFGVIVLTNSDDGKPGSYAAKAWVIVAPAVKKVTAITEKPLVTDSAWTKFTGDYVWSDSSISKVMLLAGVLAIVDPTSDNPWEDRIRLEPVSAGVFRMKDQWQKGELVRFELDGSGKTVRLVMPGSAAIRR